MKILQNPELLDSYIKRNKINNMIHPSLNQYMQLAQFEKKEYLYHQDENLDSLYLFVKGKIKVSYSMSNGKENVLRLLKEPRIVGEIELILDIPAATTLLAMETTHCIIIPLGRCRSLLLKDAVFLKAVSYNMAEALFIMDNNASINQSFSPKNRVVSYILSTEHNLHFQIDLKNLPNIIGISDRHLFRIISELLEDDMIRKDSDGYSISNLPELELIAGDLYLP